MEDKAKCVIGIYDTRRELEVAVQELERNGFAHADISVLMPNLSGLDELAHSKATKAPEGATTGGTSGAVIGGTLGLLVGIGALAIPGIGPFIAAGPIMATLAGAGAGGVVGGVTGGLIGLGMPEYEAKRYEGFVKGGGHLLSVHTGTSDLINRAEDILKRTGARDISSTSEVQGDQTHIKKSSSDVRPDSTFNR